MQGYKGNYRYTDEEIKRWAEVYVDSSPASFERLEKGLGVSHSTIWWGFTHRLPRIDRILWIAVDRKIKANKIYKKVSKY